MRKNINYSGVMDLVRFISKSWDLHRLIIFLLAGVGKSILLYATLCHFFISARTSSLADQYPLDLF